MIKLKNIEDCNNLVDKTIYEVCDDLEEGVWISTFNVEEVVDIFVDKDNVNCTLCGRSECSDDVICCTAECIHATYKNERLFYNEGDAINYALPLAKAKFDNAKKDYDSLLNRINTLKKGRCYLRTPSPYFIQYTGDNDNEVINFLHEIDAPIDIDFYEIKEIEIDGEKLLNFVYDDGFYKEEFSVNVGSFIVIEDIDNNNINEYSEYEFNHCFHIANDDVANYDEGGAK